VSMDTACFWSSAVLPLLMRFEGSMRMRKDGVPASCSGQPYCLWGGAAVIAGMSGTHRVYGAKIIVIRLMRWALQYVRSKNGRNSLQRGSATSTPSLVYRTEYTLWSFQLWRAIRASFD
jgi:hypothetical protein